MKSKVSVIVTCFNHEDYIEECLRSIFSQTYSNIELFVFNDGSTDNSGKIIEQVLTESPFFETKYIYDENRGVVAVRNEGLGQFTGDYVLFVDSDNFLNNDHINSFTVRTIRYCLLSIMGFCKRKECASGRPKLQYGKNASGKFN